MYLIKRIAESVFNFLSTKEVDAIEDVLRSIRHFQALPSIRVTSLKFERLQVAVNISIITFCVSSGNKSNLGKV